MSPDIKRSIKKPVIAEEEKFDRTIRNAGSDIKSEEIDNKENTDARNER